LESEAALFEAALFEAALSEAALSVPDLVDWPSLAVLGFASLSVADLSLAAGLLERSFLAQPDPLNTIAGVESILRMSAPQRSHWLGPESWTPCITSTMWPFTQA
jgi:hypothetical protein